jgi:hypothetical protein
MLIQRFVAPAFCAVSLVIASQAFGAPLGNSRIATATSSDLLKAQYSDREHQTRWDDRGYGDARGYRDEQDRGPRYGTGRGEGRGARGEAGGDDRSRAGNGASFWLRVGDTRIAAKCPMSESMRACVDATLMLLDKAKALHAVPAEPSQNASPSTPR